MLNTEQILCGMIINRPEILDEVLAEGVRLKHFVEPHTTEIFARILAADQANRPFDLVALGQILDPDLIPQMVLYSTECPVASHPKYYCQLLLGDAFARKVGSVAREISTFSQNLDRSQDIASLKAEFDQKIDSISEDCVESDYSALAASDAFVAMVDQIYQQKLLGKRLGVSTGLKKLDVIIHGFRPGGLYIIGARPGVGKSEVCCNFAMNAVKLNHPALFFTFEMTREEITGRMISRLSKVSDAKILNATASDDELDKMADAVRDFAKMPMFIIDNCRMIWEELKLKIRHYVRKHKVEIVFIDYIQQLRANGFRASDRVRELSLISTEAKELAKELRIAIICAAQLNRQSGDKDDTVPQKRHLKESGSLEQDANVVMLLHRKENGLIDIIVDKNRHGKEGTLPVKINFETHTLEDLW